MPDPRVVKKVLCDDQLAAWVGHGFRVVPSHAEEYAALTECCAKVEPVVGRVLAEHGSSLADWPYLADAIAALSSLALAGALRPQELQELIDLEGELLPALKAAVRPYL